MTLCLLSPIVIWPYPRLDHGRVLVALPADVDSDATLPVAFTAATKASTSALPVTTTFCSCKKMHIQHAWHRQCRTGSFRDGNHLYSRFQIQWKQSNLRPHADGVGHQTWRWLKPTLPVSLVWRRCQKMGGSGCEILEFFKRPLLPSNVCKPEIYPQQLF